MTPKEISDTDVRIQTIDVRPPAMMILESPQSKCAFASPVVPAVRSSRAAVGELAIRKYQFPVCLLQNNRQHPGTLGNFQCAESAAVAKKLDLNAHQVTPTFRSHSKMS
jgi:hypothetical protein